ncbi:toll/interleukin-1 receptor domain-containing protein [Vibrio cyclitrophicus]|uniref:toll/interleukin-1 receptor domain-containing protein n=1 Tax=Vibrio cyclitrophicus TaxID=47951 RepID=UPI000C831A34|nr:toll/interleukin-1 receptor domain-containing protein [Vibrio cyclitrophicus]NOH19017.1 toll/interleukin-1 receptor domain-containing protein [Vibrio cyclitrophicus]PMF26742.1 hypothetical protein BCV18_09700 [Vibrio cyclitrophicus]PMH40233.1 hypothetical protein BCU69_16105 [Vibrio cyclitrophicus]
MKILFVCIAGKAKNPYANDSYEYDMDASSHIIRAGISLRFPDAEISTVKELDTTEGFVKAVANFDCDLCICDMTSFNANVGYLGGLLEGQGKPVIYCAPSSHGHLPVVTHKQTLIYSESSIANEFREALNQEIDRVLTAPNSEPNSLPSIQRQKVFVSYSHADRDYLDRLLVHLKPLEKLGALDVWEDSKIMTGAHWQNEIDKALQQANIAILMISADFLASDFIVNNELPPLLTKAEVQGTKIVPVIVSPCRFAREQSLNKFQAVNNPTAPLSQISSHEREAIYDKLSQDIENAVRQP